MRTPTQDKAATQNAGSAINIVAITKLIRMSPNALFRPSNGSKFVWGRFHPQPHP
ncbi:hypothetical protein D3C72_2555630 [compost metagenome]